MPNNATFLTKLDTWTPLRAPLHSFFSNSEIDKLFESARSFDESKRTVVIVACENTYAYLGGLAAVTRYLPHYLVKSGERVIFISPFYKNIPAVKQAYAAGEIKEIFSDQPCELAGFRGAITCYQMDNTEYISYYIDIEKYFEADHNPYNYYDKTKLTDDALAFCCAVPFVLQRLNLSENILVHTHDWETAPAALSMKISVLKNILKSVKTVLTLHNSYDAPLPEGTLEYYLGKKSHGRTVLQTCIPLLDGPLTTVSEPFAYELMHDPLQTGVFADHLQTCFSMNPPVGIGNGLFKTPKRIFTKKILAEANQGEWQPIDKKKNSLRRKLTALLSGTIDERIIGSLSFMKGKKQVPIFFMSGRFDTMQKGYDVIFHAFKRLKRGSAKLIFSPSNPPATEKDPNYVFFTNCTHEYEGDITIWPFIIPREVYQYFISGSSYLLMPSFYEPFGAATEGFINGTPVVARGTGGLWDQVTSASPFAIPSYYSSFLNDYMNDNRHPSGILYHEEYEGAYPGDEWRTVFSFFPEERMASKLYCSMVDAAVGALSTAIDVFHNKKRYTQLIINGLRSLERFRWDDAVEKYRRIYSFTVRNML